MIQNQPLVMEFDCGNTAVKWRLLSPEMAVAAGAIPYTDSFPEYLNSLPVGADRIVGCRAVSVAPAPVMVDLKNAWSNFSSFPIQFAKVTSECAGVVCGYEDVSQLGIDRWAAVLGASKRVQGSSVVIDAGTAITADFLDAEKRHRGGYILPGLDLMLGALAEKTAIPSVRIPLVDSLNSAMPGDDTLSAISNAMTFLLRSFVAQLSVTAGAGAQLILTGGHRELIREILDFEVSVYPDLVLDGLSLLIPVEIDS